MNNTLQIFQTEPDQITLFIDGGDNVQLFPDELENLILNLAYKLATLKGYTPDMFDAPVPVQPIAPEGEGVA